LRDDSPDWLPSNLRYVGLRRDLPLLKSIADRVGRFEGKIGVITNPIEITSYYLSKWIPSATIIGFGASVDAARATFFIEDGINQRVNADCCLVAGEHGNELIAVSKFWSLDKYLRSLSACETADYLTKATKVGFEIVRSQGYTLLDCAPVFADDIEWLLGKGVSRFKSFAVAHNKCFLSKPVSLSKAKELVTLDNFTASENDQIRLIEKRLSYLIKALGENFADSL
jgi:malate/lactate dehydrogenase